MPETDGLSEDIVMALAVAAGMPIAPAHLPGVTLNLDRLLVQARLIMAVPLGIADEPAPIFAP